MTGTENKEQGTHSIFFAPFRLDLVNEQLWRGTQLLAVRPKTFAVLRFLVEHPHRLVTRDELCQAVWPETVGSERAPKQCIRELRAVLEEEPERSGFIETLGRRGWRFIGEVVSSQQSVASSGELSGVRSPASEVKNSQSAFRIPHSAITLVGREPELTHLHRLLEKALNGERQVVFVTGEPGIGKTATVETFLSSVRGPQSEVHRQEDNQKSKGKNQRAKVLVPHSTIYNPQSQIEEVWRGWGQCIEQHGAGEAFLPVLDALGRLARGAGGAQLIELLRIYAPMWLVQLPAFIEGEELETLQRKVQGASRERMLREFAEMVEALTTGGAHDGAPLLLVLEDLHWSDVSTLDLLAFLARRKEPARLLMIGTYRPVDMLNDGHPLQGITQELYAHRRATELPLGVLSEADIAAYLAVRLQVPSPLRGEGQGEGERSRVLRTLAPLLHHHTGGNPLFLISTVEELIAQNILTQTDSSWTLQGEVADIGIAESIRQLVTRQRGRLSAEERQTLEAASVAGMEFSAAAVAASLTTDTAMVEHRCEQLAESHQFIKRLGVEEWPDGTLAARYSFLHALYQQLWHEQVTPTQLQQHHLQIGQRKERAYGERAREIAAELALHFEQGRDYPRAVQYLHVAGENAVRRSANQEAITHLTKGLELLKTLQNTAERTHQELTLQLALGDALVVVKGYADQDVETIYTRARELCQQLGEPLQLVSVLDRLAVFYTNRQELRTTRELADQMIRLAQSVQDPYLLSLAHARLGYTSYWLGELTSARLHFEQGIALYDSHKHPCPTVNTVHHGVECLSYAAWTLWALGYPEQALKRNYEAVALAGELSFPFALTAALGCAALLHLRRREGPLAREQAEAVITLSTKQGFPSWLAIGTMVRGWALAEQGQVTEGIVQMRESRMFLLAPYVLAEAYGKVGQVEEGLTVLAKALAVVDKTGVHVNEAELYRLKGELLLAQESTEHGARSEGQRAKSEKQKVRSKEQKSQILDSPGKAEACFLKAIDIARQQSAKSWELRATTSLARLWQSQGQEKKAHKMLSAIYNWFTEGFDTKDLQEAKALLDDLTANSPSLQEAKSP